MTDILCKWLNEELQLSKVVEPHTFAKSFSSGYLIGEVLHKYELQKDFSLFLKKDTSIAKVNNFTRLEPTLQMKEAKISRTMMEVMQPAAIAALHKKEHEIYCHRLPRVVERDSDLKLQEICQHYNEKCQSLNDCLSVTSPIQQKRQLKVPKPLPYTSKLQQQREAQEAQMVHTEIARFEENRKKLATCDFASSSSGHPSSGDQGPDMSGSRYEMILQSNTEYFQDIQQRLKEDAAAREKRVDRFLVEQFKAHRAQEDARRDEQLLKRVTRLTREEQRLAAVLLQMRMQKEVILKNRLFREQQYQQRREKDIQEALQREEALAQHARWERAESIRKEMELCNRFAAERRQIRYRKHFASCKDIVEQIVDLATKVGEYRLITGNLFPEKEMREWKELLFSGLPLYEFSTPLDPVELKKQEILNNQDYDEYTDMACVLGKFCSGKTTCLAKFAEAHGIYVLSIETLINEAEKAYQNEEKFTEHQEEEDNEQLLTSSTSLKPDLDTQEESEGSKVRLSARAMQGAAVEKEIRKGNIIPNELLVDIIVEAIRQVPAQSGWILDGFPADIIQAYLLEEALGGSVDVGNDIVKSRTNLAADPNPPKPPPPAPVLDLALLLDIPDECVVRRAFSHTDKDPTDKTIFLAQIPSRVTDFQDNWPKLAEWFGGKQNILVRVDADVDEEELYTRVESVLLQAMTQTQTALATPPVENLVLDSGKAPNSSSSATPVDQHPGLTDETPGSTESHSCLTEKNLQSAKSLSKSNIHSPRGHSRKGSASPCPGSSSWVYVDEPLPPGIPELLCSHWEATCDSYVNSIKTVMLQLRSQRTFINHYLYNKREDYKHYLLRPDLKQELVSKWQKDFNSIPDDIREDEESKPELHLRMDELCEQLRDISDKRKEENELEKAALMGQGWLEGHIATLINHHSVLMQVEMDRFHATLCILKVYYSSMHSRVLPEVPSKFVRIPLLNSQEIKDQEKRCPDSSDSVKTQGKDQTEPIEPSHEKLISDYEGAITVISNLVSTETHQKKTKEEPKSLPVNEESKATSSAKTKQKGKQSTKKQTDPPVPPQAPTPTPADNKREEKSHEQKVKNKIHKEYSAALVHEANVTKMRIALVKGHGLAMVDSLQSRAEQTSDSMWKWSEANYLAEIKSIDQLSEVVHHHIQAGEKLKYELVLKGTDFYLNGDCLMVPSLPPPPRPTSLEKPMGSTPTITQLESLHKQLCIVAPSGFISSPEFFDLFRDIISVNWARNTVPESWSKLNEIQLMEIVSLLTDEYELIDWRQFLLSAALPWPSPSLMQLLVVLQHFKAADTGDTGYINEEQYLQSELWFSCESAQPVPEDPSEPLPYDRLVNLRRFFFQLFADHSFSPPRLDYVSMLQYFAADTNPKQGFIRALSVELGQHLNPLSPLGQLVKSIPGVEESAELSSSELVSSRFFGDQKVSIPALLAVLCHKATRMKDDYLPPGCLSQEEHTEYLVHMFRELGYKPEDCVPFTVFCQHPYTEGLMETKHHQLVNIHRVLLPRQDEGEDSDLGRRVRIKEKSLDKGEESG
ncbi:Sperm flagellar protein 2 Protein KPL2 [Larimichthys crocea]|uniref:Sperm flagellar protein 2 Protein KPL2 n=1 Tax=Larimichthys crocea TaxID=215358 RepID=A0A6G0I3M9_LARCR|nr:Sperm flagellar protein 2 Protein KPL2 [Larimichthys crocea]